VATKAIKIVRNHRSGVVTPDERGFNRSDCEWYDKVPKDPADNVKFRLKLWAECAADKSFQNEVWQACAREPLFWLNTFGFTYDPRLPVGLQSLPFITYDIQDELVYEICQALGYYDILIEKSRDEGVSWICLSVVSHQWQFHHEQQFMMTSRKQDYVDKRGNKDCLFWKLQFLTERQPGWMKPIFQHNELTLMNKENDSTILGESSTGDVGRGGRCRGMFMDEFPTFNRDDGYNVEASTASVTNCRIFNGTPQGTGNAFFDVREGLANGERVGKLLRVHWSEDPRKNYGLYTTGAKYKELYPKADDHDQYTDDSIVILKETPRGRIVAEHDFTDYVFLADGALRSPWYDIECRRYSHPMLRAQELDIDYHNSSFRFFDEDVIQKVLADQVCEPFHIGEFTFDEGGDVLAWEDKEDGRWRLWFHPDENARPPVHEAYAAGADISAGQGASNSVLSIGNSQTTEKVAEFASPNILPEDFGRMSGHVHKLFNEAYMIWESNGPGRGYGTKLLAEGCNRFYHRQDDVSIKHKVSDIPGWTSTADRKTALLSAYRDAQHKGNFTNRSYQAVVECRQYVNLPDNKVVHAGAGDTIDPTGAGRGHGDRVIADALLNKAFTEILGGSLESASGEDIVHQKTPVHSMAARAEKHRQQDEQEQSGGWSENWKEW